MSLEDRRRRDSFTLDVFPKKSKSKSEKKSSCKLFVSKKEIEIQYHKVLVVEVV